MTIIGLIASVLAIVIAIATSVATGAFIGSLNESIDNSSSSENGAADDAGSEEQAAGEEEEQGSAAEEEQFPGQQENDVVGAAGDTLEARGVTVTASELEERSDVLGTYLCSDVQYENNSDERLSYSSIDWSLQEPSGNIGMSTFTALEDELPSGDLAPGGTTEGTVCFDTTVESGTYVLLLEGFITLDTSRAAWVNEL